MAGWWLPGNEGTINENYLTISLHMSRKLDSTGGIFIPQKLTGEGVEMLAITARNGAKNGDIKNAYVLDRPHADPFQNFAWGVDDIIYIQMLERNGWLREGLQIFTTVEDRLLEIVALKSLSQGYHGVMVLPDQTQEALKVIKNAGIKTFETQFDQMVGRINSRLNEPVISKITLNDLLTRIQNAQQIVEKIKAQVLPAIKDNSGSQIINGHTVGFPYPGKVYDPFFASEDLKLASVLHTLGSMSASHDEKFVVTQH